MFSLFKKQEVKTPKTPKDPRMIFHHRDSGLSVGVEIKNNQVRAAIAACHPNDIFTKAHANRILHGRLDSDNIMSIDEHEGFAEAANIQDEAYDLTVAVTRQYTFYQPPRRRSNLSGSVILGSYDGKSPGRHIFGPIRDVIRSQKHRRNVDSIMRELQDAIVGLAAPW